MKKKISIGIIALLVLIQFISFREAPVSTPGADIIATHQPNDRVTYLLKTACYDCHSHESHFPWYSEVAPVSWLVDHDVNEGRKHLNFSVWKTYDDKKAAHKLEECVEEVEEGEMPLELYTILHPDANLDDEQRKVLTEWFSEVRKTYL